MPSSVVEPPRDAGGTGAAVDARCGRRLGDGTVEQPLGRGGGEQRRHEAAAGRLAEHGDPARVSLKNAMLSCTQGSARSTSFRARLRSNPPCGQEPRQVDEAEGAEPVVDRHDDDVAGVHERGRVEEGLAGCPEGVRTAVDPHHDGARGVVGGREHVQREAVFAHRGVRVERNGGVRLLGHAGPKAVASTSPSTGAAATAPALRTDGRLGVSDAAPHAHAVCFGTDERSGGGRRQAARRVCRRGGESG